MRGQYRPLFVGKRRQPKRPPFSPPSTIGFFSHRSASQPVSRPRLEVRDSNSHLTKHPTASASCSPQARCHAATMTLYYSLVGFARPKRDVDY